jgi:hypothetical protein
VNEGSSRAGIRSARFFVFSATVTGQVFEPAPMERAATSIRRAREAIRDDE